ncbi:TPA: hypothetical protein PXP39_004222 [Yersinia enterocolitica]|nr:hypothetical protein [Yersinia enterocolitica]HDL7834265.1 hypothetical protein [Yersinia enterocolitica]HDL7875117.1 hypothetical protein [Yersinia enterocolitica]HDL7887689.1 hypothetical protein [Yersinia enterocolitica]HDL7896296.1 hypothetical protein [Yersinia enterocolitica]
MLSKEQLEKISNPGPVDVGGAQNPIVTEMATELLSLREQLTELKALPPVGQIALSDYDSDGTRTARVVCLHEQADWDNFQDGTLLFIEAKPAEGSEIAKFMAGVKNSMVKEVAEVIQKEALLIMFDEITPDTETIAMQYESLVKRINRPEDKLDEPM